MKQGSFLPMEGMARKTLWAIAVLCCASILTAVPTIAIFSTAESAGLHLEGTVLDSPGALRQIEIESLEEMLTSGVRENARHARLFEKDHTVAMPDFPLGGSFSGLRYDLDYITCSTTQATWQPANRLLASGTPWTETTPFHGDGVRWLPRRD